MRRATLLLGGALAAGPLLAADSGPAALEEVMVTAQKRTESVMDVPIAITVFDPRAIEERSARNLTDLGRFTAGVEMINTKSLQPTYTIRGVETNDWTIGSDPAVAVYVDGVYAARGAGAEAALIDLERVEILKGPQGTLFGRNATGGAIHLLSAKPDLLQSGRVKLSAGSYDRLDAELVYNQPIGDGLAFRVVAMSRQRDGYLENLSGPDLNDEDQWATRLGILWQASDRTEVLWRGEYSELDQHSAAVHTLIGPVFEGAVPNRRYRPFGDVSTDLTNREEREMFSTSLEINHHLYAMTLTAITGWREFDTSLVEDSDGSSNADYVFHSDIPTDSDYFSQEFRASGSGEAVKWTLGATYARERVDNTVTAIFNASTLETFAWAEILRGAGSETADLFLTSIAGLSQDEIGTIGGYTNTEVGEVLPGYRDVQRQRGLDGIAAASFVWSFLDGRGQLGDFGISADPVAGIFGQILPDLQPRIAAYEPWIEAVRTSGTYQSWALYGDATWYLTDRLNLTAGLRYTYDDKEFDLYTRYQNQIVGADFGVAFFNNGEPLLDVTQQDDWDNLSGRLVLDYALGDDTMVYASIATGFKSGGFNSLNFGPEIDTSYDEEEITNYEMGLKGQYLEGRLHLNLATFFYEYDNLQELKLLGQPIPSYNLRNSDAEGYGLEIESAWLASDKLLLSGNYSYLKTEYTDFRILEAAGETPEDDLTGEPRIGTPEHKLNLSLEYSFQLGDFGRLVPRIDYSWSDERVASLDDPTREVDAFGLTNLRLSLLPTRGRWELAAWVTNTTDEEVHIEFSSNGDTVGSLSAARVPPRMYGADFSYRF
jgi:iron complex outermembrane receptor protein